MKKGFLQLLIFLYAVSISAQENSVNEEIPKITVIKQKWSERIDFREIYGIDVFSTRNSVPQITQENPTAKSWKVNKYFLYEAVLKNETDKNIIAILCNYVFYDPVNQTELGRHRLSLPITKWKKGKDMVIYGKTTKPPTETIDIDKIGDKKRLGLIEMVEIRCLIFEDKTYWQNALVTDSECKDYLSATLRYQEFKKRKRN